MVLLVEDERLVRDLVRGFLRHAGYEVIDAASAEEALELVSRLTGEIQALVTDVMLPGLDGTELARELRTRIPTLKVLFMSGHLGDTISRDPLVAPDTAFITKPFTRLGLLAALKELIGAPPP